MMAQTAQNDDDLFIDELEGDFLEEEATQPASQDNATNEPEDDWEESGVPGALAVDVYQDKENIYVVAPVPGVSKNDIDLSIVEGTLTIHGTRKSTHQAAQDDYFVQECYWGEFSRSIILPVQVKDEDAEAELRDGMLTVKIPKAEQEKVKKITIKD